MIDRLTRIRDRMRATAQAPPATTEGYRALFEVVYAELDSIVSDMSNEPEPAPGPTVPVGVFWSGLEGDEIQRMDDPSDDGLEGPIYPGDLEAALAVAEQCGMPFLLYIDPSQRGEDRQPWSIYPFRTLDAAKTTAEREVESAAAYGAEIDFLICDTRIERFVPNPDGVGFLEVDARPDIETTKAFRSARVDLGPGRLLMAPAGTTHPTHISELLNLDGSPKPPWQELSGYSAT
jgi:hypothetical protein